MRNSAAWLRARKTLVGATVLAWAGFLTLAVSMAVLLPQHGGQLGPEVSVGWQARFMMLAFVAWLMTAAWCAIDAARQTTSSSFER
jgi:hypothetical protein